MKLCSFFGSAIRGAPTLYVATDAPEPPKTVRMAMGALAEGIDEGSPNRRLVTLIAAAIEVLNDYFQAPVEIDLHLCREIDCPALHFGPAAATTKAGDDATRH